MKLVHYFALISFVFCVNTLFGQGPYGTGTVNSVNLGPLVNPGVVFPSNSGFTLTAPNTVLASASYDLYIPPSYDGSEPYALMTYINSGNSGRPSSPFNEWKPELDAAKIIWVGGDNIGNGYGDQVRISVAMAAVYRMLELYNIDTNRVYVSGKSGGARMANTLAYIYPEWIDAALPLCGGSFPLPVAQDYETQDPNSNYEVILPFSFADAIYISSFDQKYAWMTSFNDFREGDIMNIYHNGSEFASSLIGGYKGKFLEKSGGHCATNTQAFIDAVNFVEHSFAEVISDDFNGSSVGQGFMKQNAALGTGEIILTPNVDVAQLKSKDLILWNDPHGAIFETSILLDPSSGNVDNGIFHIGLNAYQNSSHYCGFIGNQLEASVSGILLSVDFSTAQPTVSITASNSSGILPQPFFTGQIMDWDPTQELRVKYHLWDQELRVEFSNHFAGGSTVIAGTNLLDDNRSVRIRWAELAPTGAFWNSNQWANGAFLTLVQEKINPANSIANAAVQYVTTIAKDIAPSAQLCPLVSLQNSTYAVNEPNTSVTTSTCTGYQIINVPILIDAAPSANADITVNVIGGTATLNDDYSISNTTFTLSGGGLIDSAEIWVYNDNIVEGDETILLQYVLNANGGNAYTAIGASQSVTITINDDDLDPVNMVTPVTVLDYGFESGFGAFSTLNTSGATAFQIGNNGTVPNGAFAIPATNTTEFAWIDDDNCNCNQNDVDLIFPSVDLSNMTSATINFDTFFTDGTYGGANEDADLLVSVNGGPDQLAGSIVPNGAWVTQSFDATPLVGNNDVVFKIKYSDGGGWLYGLAVDNILISGDGAISIQTLVNSGAGMEANLGPNQTIHFYDPVSQDVMMTLENTSTFDYGCVTVEVDRDGATPTALEFNSANVSDYLHSKTYTVTPTNANPTGNYNATLYYKEAEVVAWETVTGNSRNNAEIVKVDGGNQISDVTPATAASYTISNSAATVGAFYGDVTFTSSFSTGFSGFGVGIYNAVVGIAPVANFSGAPTTICEGGTVTFTDLSTNSPTGWSWDFGDTGTSTAQNPTHVYATAGTYTVTLTATNGSGSDPFTITNYITVNAIPTVVGTGAVTICDGASTTISGSGATTYSWDQGLGAGSSFSVSPSTTTTYTVTGTSSGCSNTDAVTITVTPTPAVIGAGATTICDGASTTISGSGATTYSWDQGLGAGSSFSVSPTTTTTYTVTGTSSGCSNTDAVTITVTPLPTVVGTGATTICDGASTTISGSGATTYVWDQGLGAGSSFSVSPSTTTIYNVTGTTAGCSGGASVTITVTPSPTVVGTGTTTICDGTSTTISGSGATTYSWDQGLGSGSSFSVSPSTTTTYTVTGTSSGCSNTDAVTITVTPSPAVVGAGATTICDGASTTISGSGATTYSWNQGLGAGSSFSVSPSTTTTYTVTGTSSGCSNTDAVTITVNATPAIMTGTVTNPSTCATATGSIVVNGSGIGNVSWTGTASGSATSVSMPYTISGLAAGSYTITYVDGNGCTSNALAQALVDPSAPTVTANGTATICEGASTTISGSGATTYSWDQGLGAGSSFSVSPTVTTTYSVTGITAGCSNTDAVTITVTPSPAVVGAGATTICDGASTTISGSGATTYSWNQGLGAGSSFSVSPSTTTTYTVTGTSSGCSNTDAVTITVNATPAITTGTITNPSTCATATGSIVVNGSGTGNVSWTGTASGSATSVSMPYTISGLAAGSYTITYADGNGCTSNTLVESLSDPSAPTITATGTATICAGNSTTISGSGGTTYIWDNGLGAGASQTVSPTVTTTYTVTGTTGGCSSADQLTITVMDPTTSTQDVEICEGSSYTVLTSTYTATGTYTDVTVNSVGCDSTITTNLTVNPNPMVTVTPSTIDTMCSIGSSSIALVGTPGGGAFSGTGVTGGVFDPIVAGVGSHTITYDYTDGNGCAGSTSVIAVVVQCAGIKENGLDGVSLYPNPTSGILTISGLEINSSYEITTADGKIVVASTAHALEETLDLSHLSKGIYYFSYSNQKIKAYKKFIKLR